MPAQCMSAQMCTHMSTRTHQVPNREIDKAEGKFYSNWDKNKLTFTVQLYLKDKMAMPARPCLVFTAPKRHGRLICCDVLAEHIATPLHTAVGSYLKV